jgi:antitoxin ParD1/3/4
VNTVEEIRIVLPTDMVEVIRGAVASGEFASSTEVVRDALQGWATRRLAAFEPAGAAALRTVWEQAVADPSVGVAAHEVLDRLERKYKAMAAAAAAADNTQR